MHFLVDGKRLQKKLLGLAIAALRLAHFCKIVERDGEIDVIGWEVFGEEIKRPFEQLSRFAEPQPDEMERPRLT